MMLNTVPRPPSTLAKATADSREDSPSTGSTMVLPGDIVTCAEGHPVYRVIEPIRMGERPRSSWFRRLDNDQPPAMGVAPRCPHCGSRVFQPLGLSGCFGLFIDGRLVGGDTGKAD